MVWSDINSRWSPHNGQKFRDLHCLPDSVQKACDDTACLAALHASHLCTGISRNICVNVMIMFRREHQCCHHAQILSKVHWLLDGPKYNRRAVTQPCCPAHHWTLAQPNFRQLLAILNDISFQLLLQSVNANHQQILQPRGPTDSLCLLAVL